MSVTDWLLRASDGNNFIASSKYNIWGVTSTNDKHFLNNVKVGDRLWFIMSKSNGKILAVATYTSHNKRELGPLITLTSSNTELGWTKGSWDTEVHYTDLYNLSDCMLLTHIESPLNIRKYNEKCKIQLSEAYENIKVYSRITREM
jgi:aryl-phospho-beta-D-glucosidase BglC (GH1 family)